MFSKEIFAFLFFLFSMALCLDSYAVDSLTDSFESKNKSNLFDEVELSPASAVSKNIASIEIEGNTRTNLAVIYDNLELIENSPFELDAYHDTLKNLKNLQIFSRVKIEIYDLKDNKIKIKILLKEKWTLLPYAIAGSGGGSSYFALGMYDSNFLGNLYTLNLTYACKNSNCSTVLFFKNPNLFDSNLILTINPAIYHLVSTIYHDDRSVYGYYSNRQYLFSATLEKKVDKDFSYGGGLVFQGNTVDTNGMTPQQIEENKTNQFYTPQSSSSTALEGRFSLGRVDYDGLHIDGYSLSTVLDTTLGISQKDAGNFTSIANTILFYKELLFGNETYVALRTNLSLTSGKEYYQHFFLGGLDKIRGFYDGEFQGSYSWFSNLELRTLLLSLQNFAIQNVFFTDLGNASDKFGNLVNLNVPLSLGVGVRGLFPDVNKVALRMDLAWTINPFPSFGLSFGVMQFF